MEQFNAEAKALVEMQNEYVAHQQKPQRNVPR